MLEQKDIQAIAELIHGSEERMCNRMDAAITTAITASEERMCNRMDAAIAASEERMCNRMDAAIAASEERMCARMDTSIATAIAASEERMCRRMDLAIHTLSKQTRKAISDSEKRMKKYVDKRFDKAIGLLLGEQEKLQDQMEERIGPLETKIVQMEKWYRGERLEYQSLQGQIDRLRERVENLEKRSA